VVEPGQVEGTSSPVSCSQMEAKSGESVSRSFVPIGHGEHGEHGDGDGGCGCRCGCDNDG
jgi:hypothetical protein